MGGMVDHDRLFKELLSTFFVEFIELFFPELAKYLDSSSVVFLDKEIFSDVTSGETHEVDLVARVKVRDAESFFLIHAETQSRAEAGFGLRMFRYFARLHERYGLPVYPIAVFSFDRPARQQDSFYQMSLPDFDVLRFSYRVVQLNRLDWRLFVDNPNPVAAALMAKMRFARDSRPRVKLECLRMMVSLKLDRARARLISGFIDSYLKLTDQEKGRFDGLLQEVELPGKEEIMEIVTSWMEEGLRRGREEGLQQGRQEGMREGRRDGIREGRSQEAFSLVVRLLSRRLGPLGRESRAGLGDLPVDALEQLAEDLLDFETIKDLENWLSARKA